MSLPADPAVFDPNRPTEDDFFVSAASAEVELSQIHQRQAQMNQNLTRIPTRNRARTFSTGMVDEQAEDDGEEADTDLMYDASGAPSKFAQCLDLNNCKGEPSPEENKNSSAKSTRKIIFNQPGKCHDGAVENVLITHDANYISTTQYTLISFLPKNLFMQFCKAANFYFLIMAIIVCIPGVASVNSYTSIMPLIFVLGITAIKEAIEDYKRYQSDVHVNSCAAQIVFDPSHNNDQDAPPQHDAPPDVESDSWLRWVSWRHIRVGDIVCLRDGDEIPVDLVLLTSTMQNGSAMIETSNLDGESNLKTISSLPETTRLHSPALLAQCNFRIECELPNANMHNFEGLLFVDDEQGLALTKDQVMLRGSSLQNTGRAFGVCIGAGRQTKLFLNSSDPPYKRTHVEQEMNRQMYVVFVLLGVLCTLGASISGTKLRDLGSLETYLQYAASKLTSSAIATQAISDFFNFAVLYAYMVPISLYVSLELVKLVQAYFMTVDLGMYDENSQMACKARTSNLNEELGQIEYVFSDKTGTLTQNRMAFARCSVGGVCYGDASDASNANHSGSHEAPLRSFSSSKSLQSVDSALHSVDSSLQSAADKPVFLDRARSILKAPDFVFEDARLFESFLRQDRQGKSVEEFLLCMALAHGCLVNPGQNNTGLEVSYASTSPDEVALTSAAARLGITLIARDQNICTLEIVRRQGTAEAVQVVKYEVLDVIEFTSERRRMTVIVRCPDGTVKLYSKGADSSILPRLQSDTPAALLASAQADLDKFSRLGLRTLCMASKSIDAQSYEQWSLKYKAAARAIGNRAEQMFAVAEEIEVDLNLLGVSAIEDKLQDGVQLTITRLRRAGIKVWVLTGDKMETAVNIGKSCSLLDDTLQLQVLKGTSAAAVKQCLQTILLNLDHLGKQVAKSSDSNPSTISAAALVADGPALQFALAKASLRALLLQLIQHPMCRVCICSRMAPRQKAAVVELVKLKLGAITLAIGDGANDVPMIQSAHVGIGVSGNEGLQAVNSSDYSIAQFRFLSRLLFVHGSLSYRRTTKLILYSFYKNMIISFAQLWFGIYSQMSGLEVYESLMMSTVNLFWSSLPPLMIATLDRDATNEELHAYPELYVPSRQGSGFHMFMFWSWVLAGVRDSLFVFFVPFMALQSTSAGDSWTVGLASYSILVIVINFKMLSFTSSWNVINHFFTWMTIVVYLLFAWGYSSSLYWSYPLYGAFTHIVSEPAFYLSVLLCVGVTLAFDFVVIAWLRNYRPHLIHHIQERRVLFGDSPERFPSAVKEWNAETGGDAIINASD